MGRVYVNCDASAKRILLLEVRLLHCIRTREILQCGILTEFERLARQDTISFNINFGMSS